ncbi:MAG TPA: HD domain-containing phosphohydrolase [Gemmatimonadaceae bacterium]|jgi:response regulator RpfG family c-di-GMP phosphodiesterase|nr:HD domain-containing phosphohydrolase [Gemmatimonadaceae bacterium]
MSEQTPASVRISRAFSAIGEPAVRRVLVVDDEESIRNAMGKFLKARGYDVAVADSGAAALEILQNERFDALLCDVRMPGMSGTEVVPRAIELRPDIAVLMLTAVNDAPTATEALAHGAMDYLMKPVELDDLAKAVERALRKRDMEIQQRNVERMIREEVALRTEELRREQALLAEISISIVRALVNAQEAKDPFLRGHSQRVAAMSAAIASAMGLPDDTVEDLRLSGQLHDIGKIGIPEALLHKAGPLTEEEYTRVKEHVRIGMDILTPLTPLARVLPAIQDHHERWDGSGYPRQLAGEQISLGGRILAAVDAFDALTSRRAYREPLTPVETLDLLSGTAGAHLDPSVMAALRRMVLGRTSLHFIDEAH